MKRTGNKKKLLMVCEAFGGGVFTYVSQLCNDMVDDFDVYLAYSLRPQRIIKISWTSAFISFRLRALEKRA